MYNLNLLTKLMVLLRHILVNLAIAVNAEAILMQISAEQVPSSHGVAPRHLKVVISSNLWPFMLIPALMFVLLVMILLLFCADFHFICPCSVYESVGEVLKFTIAAAHKIDVVSKSKVA